MQAKYKNKSRNGLRNGHEYIIQISKPTGHYYVYDCHVIFEPSLVPFDPYQY